MSRRPPRPTGAPENAKLAALAGLSGNLYSDHVERRPAGCWCDAQGPDQRCDVGESLFRLRAREMAGGWARA